MTTTPFTGPKPVSDQEITDSIEVQAKWCRQFDANLTAEVLQWLADNHKKGGVIARLTKGWAVEPTTSALALRLAGGINYLVIKGKAPELERYYPPNIDLSDTSDLATKLENLVEANEDFFRKFLHYIVQTNETGRSQGLLGGFLEIAKRTGLPLNLLEIGASAGLNQLWDKFHYKLGTDYSWGDPASPVQLECEWTGSPPPLDVKPEILARAGCDLTPVNIQDEDETTRIESYIWPDQTDRIARFRAAVQMALRENIRVDEADAAAWLEAKLKERPDNATTVVYHSIMWYYMPAAVQNRILDAIQEAGKKDTPLAWLRVEPVSPDKFPEILLNLWPEQKEYRLGTCHHHGYEVRWNPKEIDYTLRSQRAVG